MDMVSKGSAAIIIGAVVAGTVATVYAVSAMPGTGGKLSLNWPSNVQLGQTINWTAQGITPNAPYTVATGFNKVTGSASPTGTASGTFTIPSTGLIAGSYEVILQDNSNQAFVGIWFTIGATQGYSFDEPFEGYPQGGGGLSLGAGLADTTQSKVF